MNTAVQLLPIASIDRPRCALVLGEPRELVAGELGHVALFGPGQLVAYRLQNRRRSRVYIFRTLDVVDRLAASIPGGRPSVRLLVELRSAGRRLAGELFAYLVKAETWSEHGEHDDSTHLPARTFCRRFAELCRRGRVPGAYRIDGARAGALGRVWSACAPVAQLERPTRRTPHEP